MAVGHINHSLFWKNLAPQSQGGGELPEGALKKAIEQDFGSVDGAFCDVSYRAWR
jgi:superoxide dismutase, Fe-Mn family